MSAQAVVLAQNVPQIVVNAVSQAATFNSAGIDLQNYEGVLSIVVQTGAITGTLDGKIQDSADNTAFADLATPITFTQVTAANKIQAVPVDARSVRRYIRYVGTIVTGPVLISVVANGFKKMR
jgi:hypothetical protein